ncbi:MAG: hypothetical protein KGI75_09095, partial [Rhizobiaceae bacterium]|nr:hypothetical protein [Rhizobiaceae bacterium]
LLLSSSRLLALLLLGLARLSVGLVAVRILTVLAGCRLVPRLSLCSRLSLRARLGLLALRLLGCRSLLLGGRSLLSCGLLSGFSLLARWLLCRRGLLFGRLLRGFGCLTLLSVLMFLRVRLALLLSCGRRLLLHGLRLRCLGLRLRLLLRLGLSLLGLRSCLLLGRLCLRLLGIRLVLRLHLLFRLRSGVLRLRLRRCFRLRLLLFGLLLVRHGGRLLGFGLFSGFLLLSRLSILLCGRLVLRLGATLLGRSSLVFLSFGSLAFRLLSLRLLTFLLAWLFVLFQLFFGLSVWSLLRLCHLETIAALSSRNSDSVLRGTCRHTMQNSGHCRLKRQRK